MYLPSGATSTPCGDLPQGMKYTRPGFFAGSMTLTPPIIWPSPLAASCSASFQSTAAM